MKIRLGLLLLFIFLLGSIFYYYQKPSKYIYQLAICAMFKNEAPWLKEWIEYHHQILGVDHFYLYNNESSDDYLEVLTPYIKNGIVELIDWDNREEHAIRGFYDVSFVPYQLGAYNDCLKKIALGRAKWVAVIDIDEFIVPVDGSKSLHDLLDRKAKTNTASLWLCWRVFGTSRVKELASNELLIEKLILRAPDQHQWNLIIKSIHRPEAIKFCTPHDGKLYEGYKKKRVKAEKFRIHHYWTRTEESFFKKRGLSGQDAENLLNAFNSCEDKTIFPYISELRKHMFQIPYETNLE